MDLEGEVGIDYYEFTYYLVIHKGNFPSKRILQVIVKLLLKIRLQKIIIFI